VRFFGHCGMELKGCNPPLRFPFLWNDPLWDETGLCRKTAFPHMLALLPVHSRSICSSLCVWVCGTRIWVWLWLILDPPTPGFELRAFESEGRSPSYSLSEKLFFGTNLVRLRNEMLQLLFLCPRTNPSDKPCLAKQTVCQALKQ